MDEIGIIARKSYAKTPEIIELPDLLDIQINSYDLFLQADVPPEKRENKGLQSVFRGIFPISDIHNAYTLEFVNYSMGKPKYSIKECQERDSTYAAPLKATLRLISRDRQDKEKIKDIIEQSVFLGELPLMTQNGTFVINGVEKVIVSQLHRSPGCFFDETTHPNGKNLYSARVIPDRGTWFEFSMDINDLMYVQIERKRKIPVTVLLRALGFPTEGHILAVFHGSRKSKKIDKNLANQILMDEILDKDSGEVLIDWLTKLDTEHLEIIKSVGVKEVQVLSSQRRTVDEDIIGHICLEDIVDESNGELTLQEFEVVTENSVMSLQKSGIKRIEVVSMDPEEVENGVIKNTLNKDTCDSQEEALSRIYSLLRPGDPPNVETAKSHLEKLFFNPKRYNLGEVGRYRINQRLQLDIPLKSTVLHKKDFISIIGYLSELHRGGGYTDDIDHLGNRRVRSVGELASKQFSAGLSRMAKTIRERMSLRDSDSLTPQALVNARTVSTGIMSFFGSGQLSQFMAQINPLDELTHKRRLSALGPGGLTKDRAGFEVRDVHHTHYGRICPIETPEGPNIGLIASLSTYTRVNSLGFLETPYRVVKNGKVTSKIEYLSADTEDRYTIAQANSKLDKNGRFSDSLVKARKRGDFPIVYPKEIDYMDVSPKQLVSVAAALIPFLEHDDANRALMGSNMQRQGVPLLKTHAPYVGTGIERKTAMDSGVMIMAKNSGQVIEVTADRITVKKDKSGKDESSSLGFSDCDRYHLTKFKRSNHDCCVNQRPIVRVKDKVQKGDVLADGPSTDRGDLALGANVLVAFMSWSGCNFEDAILVSERLLKEDVFTSIHIEEFEIQVRDTKRGVEEITREIPNVNEQFVRNLDESGIIRVGAEVGPNDILVGKVTPKGETELSPEERLLRAIFGEKAGDVRDASLRAPAGMDGVVMGRVVFSRKERDENTKKVDKEKIEGLRVEAESMIKNIKSLRDEQIRGLLQHRRSRTLWNKEDDSVVVNKGRVFTEKLLKSIDFDRARPEDGWTADDEVNRIVEQLIKIAQDEIESVKERLDHNIDKITRGDELPPGIVQLIKVYVARKRRLSVGDKMAGRHGNKGVVSKIVPEEDMPYLPNGTPVDVILNPLGVPGRMNLGQILETHLGWAAKELNRYVATPVFDGATLDEVKATLKEAGLPESGKTVLFEGRTGEPFDKEVTVGYLYMMKLSHLVADKIHARSIGPYSLVTQQPLGGKAQFGGQRIGEMEVWALEAYGAAHLLQEMLTVKSDDVAGRSKIYEAIVKGENSPEPGIPESFNVLIKELQSLGLDIRLENGEALQE